MWVHHYYFFQKAFFIGDRKDRPNSYIWESTWPVYQFACFSRFTISEWIFAYRNGNTDLTLWLQATSRRQLLLNLPQRPPQVGIFRKAHRQTELRSLNAGCIESWPVLTCKKWRVLISRDRHWSALCGNILILLDRRVWTGPTWTYCEDKVLFDIPLQWGGARRLTSSIIKKPSYIPPLIRYNVFNWIIKTQFVQFIRQNVYIEFYSKKLIMWTLLLM